MKSSKTAVDIKILRKQRNLLRILLQEPKAR